MFASPGSRVNRQIRQIPKVQKHQGTKNFAGLKETNEKEEAQGMEKS